jgi:hypothetical protein
MATLSLLPLTFSKISARASPQSSQDRCDVQESDRCEVGRDAHSPCDKRGVVVVASAWLAFYVIAAIHHFMASGN